MIQNITEWGETWEEFPQLLWNRSAFVVYWHNQYEWYTIFRTAFDLRGNMIELPKSVRESIRNRSNELCHPARIRAVLNIVPEEEVQEVAFFAWEGQPPDIGGRQLSFWVQNTEQLDRPAAKYIINGDSWINVTDGGLDMAVTPDYNSVLVHPVVGYNTLQVTKMSRDGQMLKEITIKHIARQPNLLVIDELIFLTTENEGRGMVTVLDNDLEIIATENIGGGQGRAMSAPMLYYDPILDLTMLLYTDENGQAMVQRLTVTFPDEELSEELYCMNP